MELAEKSQLGPSLFRTPKLTMEDISGIRQEFETQNRLPRKRLDCQYPGSHLQIMSDPTGTKRHAEVWAYSRAPSVGMAEKKILIAQSFNHPILSCTAKCNNCLRVQVDLKTCNGCLLARYCSKECQIAHWKKGHKEECHTVSHTVTKKTKK